MTYRNPASQPFDSSVAGDALARAHDDRDREEREDVRAAVDDENEPTGSSPR